MCRCCTTVSYTHLDVYKRQGEQILVSTAISGVSMEGAARNLAAEVPDNDFDKYLAAVQDDWNEQDVYKRQACTFYHEAYDRGSSWWSISASP